MMNATVNLEALGPRVRRLLEFTVEWKTTFALFYTGALFFYAAAGLIWLRLEPVSSLELLQLLFLCMVLGLFYVLCYGENRVLPLEGWRLLILHALLDLGAVLGGSVLFGWLEPTPGKLGVLTLSFAALYGCFHLGLAFWRAVEAIRLNRRLESYKNTL